MFDELHIRTVTIDDEHYVSVHDLANHIASALMEFAKEVREECLEREIDARDLYFSAGVAEGMREIAILLAQEGIEQKISRIETLDDLINMK